MKTKISELLDSARPGDTILLPSGEYEGSFRITKPCTIVGNHTTLWSKLGPIVTIESPGITLKNLRIEITSDLSGCKEEESVAILNNGFDVICENLEIFGRALGFRDEDQYWDYPSLLSLGGFTPQKRSEFQFEVYVPTEVIIENTLNDITFEPEVLQPGKNLIKVLIEPLRLGTYIYGDILLKSQFIRRIAIGGFVSQDSSDYLKQALVYLCDSRKMEDFKSAKNEGTFLKLQRGQRIALENHFTDFLKIDFSYESMVQELDIEPYVFLLNQDNKVVRDEDFIFFGNQESQCKSVTYTAERSILINPGAVDSKVHRIAIAHSIYGDHPNYNFSKVIKPVIMVSTRDDSQIRFYPEDLLVETTIVSVEIYRHNKGWKLTPIGAGYRDGLKRLCEGYGLTVT